MTFLQPVIGIVLLCFITLIGATITNDIKSRFLQLRNDIHIQPIRDALIKAIDSLDSNGNSSLTLYQRVNDFILDPAQGINNDQKWFSESISQLKLLAKEGDQSSTNLAKWVGNLLETSKPAEDCTKTQDVAKLGIDPSESEESPTWNIHPALAALIGFLSYYGIIVLTLPHVKGVLTKRKQGHIWDTHRTVNYFPRGGEERKQGFETSLALALSGLDRAGARHQSREENRQTITGAVGPTLGNVNPSKPSTLFVLACVNTQRAPTFTHQLAVSINRSFGLREDHHHEPLVIDFGQMGESTEIHQTLLEYLQRNGKVVLLKNLHSLTETSHIYTLHVFCDNSSAFDTRATFIFYVSDPNLTFSNSEGRSQTLSGYLERIWSRHPSEAVRALITRINGNIIIV